MNDTSKKCDVFIEIDNKGKLQLPRLKDSVEMTFERQGAPGKLKFSVIKDENLDFLEGNRAVLYVNREPVFSGYIFEKKRDKGGIIDVTAYDQIRYLKNKDTIKVKAGETASQFIKKVAAAYKLECGEICETGFGLEEEYFSNETVLDMFQKNLDNTLIGTNKIYVVYDDCGRLTLKDCMDMMLNVVIKDSRLENFDYTSSIDKETYNVAEVVYLNEDEKISDRKSADDISTINRWGLLKYIDEAKEYNPAQMEERAKFLLKRFNKVSRSLSLSNCYGDLRVRGGSGVFVDLNLGDIIVDQYFMCERVTHIFKDNMHLMSLDLRGEDFRE